MISDDNKQYFTYSDCGVIPDPDVNQLVEIAYNASNFHETIWLGNDLLRLCFYRAFHFCRGDEAAAGVGGSKIGLPG